MDLLKEEQQSFGELIENQFIQLYAETQRLEAYAMSDEFLDNLVNVDEEMKELWETIEEKTFQLFDLENLLLTATGLCPPDIEELKRDIRGELFGTEWEIDDDDD